MRDYFQLDETMCHKDCIEWVQVDGGPWGHGCWGKIKLKHEDEPRVIGDGSYYNDGKHVSHSLASWGFWRLKKIMRDELGENNTGKQHEALILIHEDKYGPTEDPS